ncbi:MAG: TIGR03621 family F420-dependent LLM class oxidoreductase [Chloroflexota bacterium]|nr:TIGR03621 family F420-dependent LLM class oxidoreductase [Chloroflexota bacterium]
MARPFRFAVGAGDFRDPRALVQRAKLAESLGYSTFLASDHLMSQLAPLQTLSAVAEATTVLRIGTFVLNNDLRHPAVLAQELASLDLLSGGRLEIGLGAGWNIDEYRAAGLSYDRHAIRFERMTEALSVLKGLFAEAPFNFSGKHYQITEMDGHPLVKPHQRPHPPFLIGGGGRQALAFAAREAQIVGLAPRLPRPAEPDVQSLLAEATAEKVEWVKHAAGERFSELELNTYGSLGPAHITDDARGAARTLAARLKERYGCELTEDEVLESPHTFIGTVDQLVDKCLMLRERFGVSYIFPIAEPEAFAPVVARLAGK